MIHVPNDGCGPNYKLSESFGNIPTIIQAEIYGIMLESKESQKLLASIINRITLMWSPVPKEKDLQLKFHRKGIPGMCQAKKLLLI